MMMGMGVESLGIMAMAKALLTLAVSFFVLLGVTKTDSKGLQQFGRIVGAGLFILAIFSLAISLYAGLKWGYQGKTMPYKKMMMNK
jgi:hypothetical protein